MKTDKEVKAIVLLSGGLDSTVSLACALKESQVILALTFDYGQRANEQEIKASAKIAEYYKIPHKVIVLDWLKEITKTSLVDTENSLPLLEANQLDDKNAAEDSARKVWVPNRNGLFINIAACFAESLDCSYIFFGANKEEGKTFPDNSLKFVQKINKSLKYSTLSQPKVLAPLIGMTKKQIVKTAVQRNVPLNLIRSCYTDEEKHCGKCESCLRLKRALEENKIDGFLTDIVMK